MHSYDYTGKTLDNKYVVDTLLGEGGMGAVYRGWHSVLKKSVAIKFLHQFFAGQEEVIKRFYREAQAASAINHKNIIDIQDVGVTQNGDPYLVMEYLEGEGLAELLERKKTIDLAAACAILEPTLHALKAAHDKNIVHRDLKPDNIFVVKTDAEAPEIKLIDFGISKFTSTEFTKLTQDGSTLGTPAYMSPEQARGAPDVNHLTDIYAVGVIFYEMLTGDMPFSGQQYNELLYNVLTQPPKHPLESNINFPMKAWPLIERALSKDKTQRQQNCIEMIEEMRGLCSVEKKIQHLTLLGNSIETMGCATGTLGGKTKTISNPDLAKKLLSDATEPTHIAKPIHSTPNTPQNTQIDLSRAPLPQKIAQVVKQTMLVSPNKKRNRIIAAAGGFSLFTLLLIGIISLATPDLVQIEIKGIPAKSRIYYDGSQVMANPFKVEKNDRLVPLKIETKGKNKLSISVVPLEDQVIEFGSNNSLLPATKQPTPTKSDTTKKKTTKRKTTSKKKAGKNDTGDTTKTSGTKKKKRSNPFKKLGRSIKRAFN